VCLAVIIGFYHSFYDLVILVLPTVLVTRVDFAGGWAPTRYRLGLLIAMLIACFNPFRFGPLADALEGSPTLFRVLSPGLTGLALATAFALALVVVYRLPEPVTGHVGSDESDHFAEPL
jgi:hypothetical protein